tara:strand:+ start:562 stop:1134 length:573 start_codon:yes stop_codon:yes gene_type:complete
MSLQKQAYKKISPNTYKNIKNDTSKIKENSVLDIVREEIKKDHHTLKEWIKTINIPKKYQNILIMMDSFTKPNNFHALSNIRKLNQKYDLKDYFEFYNEFCELIKDKYLVYRSVVDVESRSEWKRPHYVLNATFSLLCYKRLNKIFKLDVDDCGKEFLDEIREIEESEITSFIIYTMVNRTYGIKNLEHI